jgi:hypothetical protein
MLRSLIALLLLVLFASVVVSAVDQGWVPTPLMRTVDPASAKAGAVVLVTGDHLDQSRVAQVFLQKGEENTQVEIVSQAAKSLKFKVPASVAPGRYRLVVLTAGPDPSLLEEPVSMMVVE